MNRLSKLDKIDISLYLIYDEIERVMNEIVKDYGNIFDGITEKEFKKYIKERYGLL